MRGRERHLAVLWVVLNTRLVMAEKAQEMSFDLSGKAEGLWCEGTSGLCPQTLTESQSSRRRDGCPHEAKRRKSAGEGQFKIEAQLQGSQSKSSRLGTQHAGDWSLRKAPDNAEEGWRAG